MQQHTNRQYNVWMEWLRQQWNNPSRSDNYLMQIAVEVKRVLSKTPNKIKHDQFEIPFTFKKRKAVSKLVAKEQTVEQATQRSKSRWFGWLGMKGK